MRILDQMSPGEKKQPSLSTQNLEDPREFKLQPIQSLNSDEPFIMDKMIVNRHDHIVDKLNR
jgi:hypothetical protein